MKTGYKVGDAMTFSPISVTPDTTIVKCSKIMDDKHIGSVLIIEDKKLMGIITEYDIVRKIVAKLKDPSKVKAKDIMVKRPITITPDKDIYDALVILRDNNIRHLPVTIGNELKGFLTLNDREILKSTGKISHKLAMEKGENEFEKFKINQQENDNKIESDFDKYLKKLEDKIIK
jgi:CBS domain-containing protein